MGLPSIPASSGCNCKSISEELERRSRGSASRPTRSFICCLWQLHPDRVLFFRAPAKTGPTQGDCCVANVKDQRRAKDGDCGAGSGLSEGSPEGRQSSERSSIRLASSPIPFHPRQLQRVRCWAPRGAMRLPLGSLFLPCEWLPPRLREFTAPAPRPPRCGGRSGRVSRSGPALRTTESSAA